MKHPTRIAVLVAACAVAAVADTKIENGRVSKDEVESCLKTAMEGGEDAALAKAVLRLTCGTEEGRALVERTVDSLTATGGRPMPDSDEPLAFRVDGERVASINRLLGFSDGCERTRFPALSAVTNVAGLKLDCAERFEAAAKGKMALFPDGSIRWSEDGTNGFSFAETAARMQSAQIGCVRELMQGMEQKRGTKPNDKSSEKWILNDDFTFGYFTIPHKDGRDEVYYVFTTRHEMNGTAAKTSVLVPFAPSQLISDSIMRSFLGDKAAQSNFNALKNAGIVMVVE